MAHDLHNIRDQRESYAEEGEGLEGGSDHESRGPVACSHWIQSSHKEVTAYLLITSVHPILMITEPRYETTY